jgi:hypothetical protein
MKSAFELNENELFDLIKLPYDKFARWLRETHAREKRTDVVNDELVASLKKLVESLEANLKQARPGTEAFRNSNEKLSIINRFYTEVSEMEEERRALLGAMLTTRPMILNENAPSQEDTSER